MFLQNSHLGQPPLFSFQSFYFILTFHKGLFTVISRYTQAIGSKKVSIELQLSFISSKIRPKK
jgi:hypothetical protein